jgi:hypothetical protein
MTVETVYQSVHSGVSEVDTRVIRNEEEARRYFGRVMAHLPEVQETPAVDYRRWMLLAVGLGSRRNGGYSVEITAVRRQADTLMVDYVETEPGPACIVSQVITHPVHVVKIPAFDGEVLFRGSKVVDDCR